MIRIDGAADSAAARHGAFLLPAQNEGAMNDQ